jgi:cytochrome c553
MRRPLGSAVLLALLAPVLAAQGATATEAARFFATWCVSCHAGERPSGGLDLSRPDGLADATFQETARRLRKGTMPPKDAAQPPKDEIVAFLALLDARAGAASRPGPGRVTLRRLSKYEYRCSIRDLFGLDAPTGDFPVDDSGYGFDNVADVLTVTPLLFEKYAAAAEKIAAEAILCEDPDRPPRPRVTGRRMASELPPSFREAARVLFKNGRMHTEIEAPRAGEYVLRVRAWADQAGPEAAKMTFGIDGAQDGGTARREVEVPATKDAPEEYELRARVRRGTRRIAVAFTNDFYQPDNPDPAKRDRNLVVEWIELVGPVDRVDPPASHREIFAADPGGADAAARLRAILPPLLLRAWRRPATAGEIRRLTDLAAGAPRIEDGLRLALEAILASPHFLFRAEPDPPGAAKGSTRDLTGFELASRLSYFLWSSVPDRRLLDAAAAGRLSDLSALRAEAARMIDDPKASALAENFAAQWLELRNLDDAAPDPARFPDFDEELRDAMRRETELLFEAVLRERRPLHDLVDADFTFVNARLARHYGVQGVTGSSFRRVAAPAERGGGFLAHASVLTVTSNATRTSPVKRGKFVLDNVLDEPAPPPPPGVGALEERPDHVKGLSIRERLERHRKDPSCASCHARIDGLGFALESFDPVGAWRTRDEGAPVDATASRPGGGTIAGLPGLRALVREEGSLARCLAKKLFVYAIGRGVEPRDERAVAAILAALPGPEPVLRDLVLGIVELEAFRRRDL